MPPTSSNSKSKDAYAQLSSASERPMHGIDIRSIQERRLGEFVGGQYARWNLASVLFEEKTHSKDVISVSSWSPKAGTKPSFDEAIKHKFEPIEKGYEFGPSWSNHWVRLEINIPEDWHKKEWVELEFDPSCDAMVFNSEGLSLQGLTGAFNHDRRVDFPIKPEMRKGVTLYIEVTCNGMFGVDGPSEGDPDPNRYFALNSCDIVVKRPEAWRLLWDFELLRGCVDEMPRDGPLQNRALWVANKIQDTFRHDDLSSITRCRKIAEEILGKDWEAPEEGIYEEGNRKGREDTLLWAIGHTHIDTAWLWPYAATQQKVARSWSSQLDLMERYPEHKFTASTAQQYAWLEELYPKLFARVQKAVKRGTFQPVGGTWVECDGNMPSGEAFARQFLYGQRYFESRFGKRCSIFWLPDSFGYSTQLPQLARLSGCEYFFTQKLSWNNIDRFPHNTVMWVGIDGTQIITHLTPVDNYDSTGMVNDIVRGVRNNQNLNVQPTALQLFGWGDGGGGPTAPHLERLRRARATYNNGWTEMPKVTVGKSARDFYDNILESTEGGERLPRWHGELYLEFHRGVLTSHGSIKRWNRKLEVLMGQIEMIATVASLRDAKGYKYPKADIDSLWEPLLTNQFHDVLPGSAIHMVYTDAERIYADIAKRGEKVLKDALAALGDCGIAINTLCQPRSELIAVDSAASFAKSAAVQKLEGGKATLMLTGDAAGAALPEPVQPVVATESNGDFTLRNENVSMSVSRGYINSLRTRQNGEWVELIARGRRAGLTICEDYPPTFDAWETELYSFNTVEHIEFSSVRITETGPWRAALALEARFGQSTVAFAVSLDAIGSGSSAVRFDAQVDWQEKHRFLRFEVFTPLVADQASYETSYGITRRPTKRNTTWEAAQFEVCAHKFFDLSESSLGLSILSDSKYGASVEGGLMRLSLLKAPTYPDAHTDEGKHEFSFALLPHAGPLSMETVHAAIAFNTPVIRGNGRVASATQWPIKLEQSKSSSVVLSAVKRGEADFTYGSRSGSGRSVVVRLYEALGTHSSATVRIDLPVRSVTLANLLEDDIEGGEIGGSSGSDDGWMDVRSGAAETLRCEVDVEGKSTLAKVHLRPFQIATLKITLA